MNNEQCDDSNFQKEGDYILNKMPKYKYDIKIIHDYRHKKEKEKASSKIVSSERFTILNKFYFINYNINNFEYSLI